jgi:hypothetical protein
VKPFYGINLVPYIGLNPWAQRMFSVPRKQKKKLNPIDTQKKEPEENITLIAIQGCHCTQKPGQSATQALTHMRLLI